MAPATQILRDGCIDIGEPTSNAVIDCYFTFLRIFSKVKYHLFLSISVRYIDLTDSGWMINRRESRYDR